MPAHVIDASSAKNAFGTLAAKARRAPVEITRHGRVESVLISPELYERVKALDLIGKSELEQLQNRFDQLVAQMQSKASSDAYAALGALDADALAGAVAKARKQLKKQQVKGGRPQLRVVR